MFKLNQIVVGNCITLENYPDGSKCLNVLYHMGAECGAQPQMVVGNSVNVHPVADSGCNSQVRYCKKLRGFCCFLSSWK